MVGLSSATPSSIISFVIDTEKKLSHIFSYLAEAKKEAEGKLKKMAEDCIRDAEQLEKVFKETVIELSLEPIEGFDLVLLRNEIENLLNSEDKLNGIVKAISKLEELYLSFAKAIVSISPEASMQLKKMARKKEKHKNMWEI